MKIDLTPSELKDLIKLHETEKKQAIKQYEKFEDAFYTYQTDEQYEKKMLDLAKRIKELDLRIIYLKRVFDDCIRGMKKLLNGLYGVNGVGNDLSIKDICEFMNEVDYNKEV